MKTHALRPDDFRTGVWERLTKTLNAELERLRELNDVRKDEISTAEIRGQIKAVKELLALAKASADRSGGPDVPARQLAELERIGVTI